MIDQLDYTLSFLSYTREGFFHYNRLYGKLLHFVYLSIANFLEIEKKKRKKKTPATCNVQKRVPECVVIDRQVKK